MAGNRFIAAALTAAAAVGSAVGGAVYQAATQSDARVAIAAAHDITTRHGELAVRVDAGSADVTSLAPVDPPTAPGQVLSSDDAGLPTWRDPSSGGPAAGSGTYAARPASPELGDTYTVTSGARTGSVYRCDVAGAWVLSRVLPMLPAATAVELLAFDAESILDVVGQSLAAWPEARGRVVLTQANTATVTAAKQVAATAASWGGLPFAQWPSSGATPVILGAPATGGPSGDAPRTFAVLVSSVPAWAASGSVAQNVGGWGIGSNAAFTIRVNANASNVTGLSFYGTDPAGSGAYPSSSTPTLLYAVYTGTQYALYQTPVDSASESTSVALTTLSLVTSSGGAPGGIQTPFGLVLGAHSWNRASEFFRGRLHGAWIYDRALDATAREALRAALATRYGS